MPPRPGPRCPVPEGAAQLRPMGGLGPGSSKGGEEAEAVEEEEQAARDGRRCARIELVPHHRKLRMVRVRRVLRHAGGRGQGRGVRRFESVDRVADQF